MRSYHWYGYCAVFTCVSVWAHCILHVADESFRISVSIVRMSSDRILSRHWGCWAKLCNISSPISLVSASLSFSIPNTCIIHVIYHRNSIEIFSSESQQVFHCCVTTSRELFIFTLYVLDSGVENLRKATPIKILSTHKINSEWLQLSTWLNSWMVITEDIAVPFCNGKSRLLIWKVTETVTGYCEVTILPVAFVECWYSAYMYIPVVQSW